MFAVIADLNKAYDFAPREALHFVLNKEGVPTALIHIIRSFHDRMSAAVNYDGQVDNEINKCLEGTKTRMLSCITLLNIYVNCVTRQWKEERGEGGIHIKFQANKKLVGGYQKKRAMEVGVMKLRFAGKNRSKAEEAFRILLA